jgi:hypothetical protein
VKTLRTIILACISSILLYLLVFTFLVKKPLTLGFIHEAMQVRAAYVRANPGPKLVIIAASNGLFSYRAEVMEKVLGIPCLNSSTIGQFGLDIQIALAKRWLSSGDIVLMPLEYHSYELTSQEIDNSDANAYILSYAPWLLHDLGWHRVQCVLGHFDLKYLISAVVEMGLAKVGISRRFNKETLTPQGDMRGHTESRGMEYRGYLQSLTQAGPSDELLQKRFQGEIVLDNFLKWAKQHNIRVIGTLPTVFNDRPISDKLIAKIASLYRSQGQEFLLLPNRSQYDRHCFYDTNYHLNEPSQIVHSRSIAYYLQPRLRLSKAPY